MTTKPRDPAAFDAVNRRIEILKKDWLPGYLESRREHAAREKAILDELTKKDEPASEIAPAQPDVHEVTP